MADWYVFDLSWLFFGVWSAVVAVASFKAFGNDLFPSRLHREDSPPLLNPPKPIGPPKGRASAPSQI